MSIDTLTADGAPVTLPPPVHQSGDGFPPGTYVEKGYAALPGQDEVVVVSVGQSTAILDGYSLSGEQIFQTVLASDYGAMGSFLAGASVFAVGAGGEFGAEYDIRSSFYSSPYQTFYAQGFYTLYRPDGTSLTSRELDPNYVLVSGSVGASNTPTGYHLEWVTQNSQSQAQSAGPPDYAEASANFAADGSSYAVSRSDGTRTLPYAATGNANFTIAVRDNRILVDGSPSAALPGEPANAVTSVAAAWLQAHQGTAAIAWADSGTDYVSLYYAAANIFGPVIGLDWGGATDLHLVALPDGGFAVSWMNGGAYKGEVFDGAGNGGGVISLAGDVAGIDSHGDLYTVGLNSSGQYVVQDYAINASGGGSSGGGSGGTTTGQTFTSDNSGDHWTGTSGDDTFHLGRGGDVVTGAGGNDTYAFAEIPWAGGHITDFNAGDVLDLTGLMSTTADTGSNGFADGYLKIASDSAGNAQVWAQYAASGTNSGWWLVETLDGVSVSSLTHTGDVITVGSSSGGGGSSGGATAVSTADPTYTAPNNVNSITLTGSHQTVTANNAQDTTIWSNDTGNTLYGGTGDDTVHIGRGGDTVTAGAGRDVFVFDDIPWAAATINDLDARSGDSIDVSGILTRAGYTGADPIADGYLKIVSDMSVGRAQVWADYHQPGNDGWWLVATVSNVTGDLPLGPLQYAGNGVIDQQGEQVGGTATFNGTQQTSGSPGVGYDTVIETGSNVSFGANNGGDTLIDQGSNNQMFGEKGNDTFVLGTSTAVASDGWGGDNIWVMNPQSTVVTQDIYGLHAGDRIDVRALLAASHYTGADPVADGYVAVTLPPAPPPGTMGDHRTAEVVYDPDGAAGPQAPRALFDIQHALASQFHYADGFFVVQ